MTSRKDSINAGPFLLRAKGSPATFRWLRHEVSRRHSSRRSRLPGSGMGSAGDDRAARRPPRLDTLARLRFGARAVRSRRPALAGHGHGALPRAIGRRALERMGDRCARGGGSAGRRHGRACEHAALAARQPVVGRRVRSHRVPEVRTYHPAACVLRPEPVRGDPAASAPEGRCAADRLARGLGRGRVDPACGAPLRAERPRRRRPPHRRLERLHGGGVGGDRPRDPRLPRQGQRLERHRLQLPRRQVRQGLRGPLRRHRPERHRGARGGVQHRLRRRRRARRVQLARGRGEGAGGARAGARVAARPRPCRAGHDRLVRLGRQRVASRPARRSSCARSPGTATRASRTARDGRSTRCWETSRATWPSSGCRSSTRPS